MKKLLFSLGICFLASLSFAQQSFIGIQNSPRKGMVHAAMNPAELNHFSRKVEVNLFAVGAMAGNNVLTFKDFLHEEDLLNLAFDRADGPVNVSAEVQLLGPSFGIKVNKWSFGMMSQVFVKGDIMELNVDLGRVFNNGSFDNEVYTVEFDNSSNQRVIASGWAELGLVAGREIWADESHLLSAGGTFKLLIPGAYVNIGMDNLLGTFSQNQDASNLSNARGNLNISYPEELEQWDDEAQLLNRFSLNNISGFAVDLGLSHQWKKNGITLFSSGLSIKNLGGMGFGSGQVTNNYSMDIPEGEFFRLDQLEGNLDEIEGQLLSSGYFTKDSQRNVSDLSLPTILSAYTDMRVSRVFHISAFGQYRLSDQENNTQISLQNVIALTPRLIWGQFEIYSPWAIYEISGLTGGAGLRWGGFFIGSQSVLTGFLTGTRQADVHVGLSLGFGKNKQKPERTDF
ncbi:MAG: DUF5723 family protein [Cyclobacteriaceae bacterium]